MENDETRNEYPFTGDEDRYTEGEDDDGSGHDRTPLSLPDRCPIPPKKKSPPSTSHPPSMHGFLNGTYIANKIVAGYVLICTALHHILKTTRN